MVPLSQLVESLVTMGTAKNVVRFLKETMKIWRAELIYGTETFKEVLKERKFSRCISAVTVCNSPDSADTHTKES